MTTRIDSLISARGLAFARDLAAAAPDRLRLYVDPKGTEWMILLVPASSGGQTMIERGLGQATLKEAIKLIQTYAARLEEAKDLKARIADVQRLVDAARGQLDQVKAESAAIQKEYASLKVQVVKQLAVHNELKARHAAAVERDKRNLLTLDDSGVLHAASDN